MNTMQSDLDSRDLPYRTRRQYHSCDQCRRAKRACDASPLGPASQQSWAAGVDVPEMRGSDNLLSGYQERKGQSCSYCQKTKKQCTRYWAQSQRQGSTPRARKGVRSERRDRKSGLAIAARPRPLACQEVGASLDMMQTLPDPQGDLSWLKRQPSSLGADAFLEDDPIGRFLLSDVTSETPGFCDSVSELLTANDLSMASEASAGSYLSMVNPSTGNDLQLTADGAFLDRCTSRVYEGADISVANSTLDPLPGEIGPSYSSTGNSQSPWSYTDSFNTLSPFSPQQTMTSKTQHVFISQNLMTVYHDVFEHSLSCWVSEESCPYWMPSQQKRLRSLVSDTNSQPPRVARGDTPSAQLEWGPSWSNRIYSLVIKLDRAAQAARTIRLTQSEDRTALKALHLSIMAFAAQWAHRSHRQREQYSPLSSYADLQSNTPGLDSELNEEFDRQIQRSLWEQARQALSECAEIECYRVVCAEIIFGLTQRPWERHKVRSAVDRDTSAYNSASLLEQTEDILSRDGPPIFIERAARKSQALKFAIDAQEAGLKPGDRARLGGGDFQQPPKIGIEDRQTAGFIYWLAVMFDTISASMYQRPVVVSDRDSHHDGTTQRDVAGSRNDAFNPATSPHGRWIIDLFIQDNPRDPTQVLRWPCSYESAARHITRSGPVKILLYRHVYYLQDALRRGECGEPVEQIIGSALLVYHYWGATYGIFFRDLIANYEAVPSRIRSWFFCILAHWNLAALLLADLIEHVDDYGLGDPLSGPDRIASDAVETIRRASASELADLARIVTPCDSNVSTTPQLPDFHSAVNQGTILTEPWTGILIRAFSKAFMFHLGEAEVERRDQEGLGFNPGLTYWVSGTNVSQCADCVRALWHLGKKSDMARATAHVLSRALARFEGALPQ